MMIDWKNNKEDAVNNGITEKTTSHSHRIFMETGENNVCGITFRIFPTLSFSDKTEITDCVFEDCGEIHFDGCSINNCSFLRCESIFSYDTVFEATAFSELFCDNDMIIYLENSTADYCRFERIELKNGSYLIAGDSDSLISNCIFSDISSDRRDGEITNCEEATGRIFKRTKRFSIVDEHTCEGYNLLFNKKEVADNAKELEIH